VRDLILKTLRESVKAYPELKSYLEGDAEWIVDVYSTKFDPPPDNNTRLKDEAELARILEDFFNKQNKRIIAELRKEFITKGIFDSTFWNKELSNLWSVVSKKISEIIRHGVGGALNLLPEPIRSRISITLLQDDVIRYAMNYREEWISTINKTTMRGIWKKVEIWRSTGQPIDELIEKIRSLGFSEMRAKRIAVTETARLNSVAHQLSYNQAGITMFRWMTYGDNNVCEICIPNHGREFPVSQLSSLIPAHPNCRCWDEPVVEDMTEPVDYGGA
jgi:SPP1 gp7 family putative phage head morphogenesis protein